MLISPRQCRVVCSGKGSFGTVTLVQHKTTGAYYALKGISKAHISKYGQHEHVVSEKNSMQRFNSPFLVGLHATMKDDRAIYFLLELCMGGELFTLLRSRTSFNENAARFYAGCVGA
jgi:serine/threonine protein kinase